jgi:hypothetical protein
MSFKLLLLLGVCFVKTEYITAQYCSYSSSCSSGRICCNNQCVYDTDCSGRSCYINSDCSGLTCCDYTCQYSCYDDQVPIIIGSIISAFFCIFIVVIVIYCCCRRRPIPSGGYIVTNPQVYTTTTTANYSQLPPTYLPQQGPYQGQQPGYAQPPPQQGYGAI